jgi:subtilisin family serine protease
MKRLPFFNKFSCPATWVVVLAVGIAFLFVPLLVQSEILLPVKAKGSSEARSDTPNAKGPPDRISVLVHLKPGADRGPIRRFARDTGGFIKYEYKTVLPNVMNLRNIPVQAIEALERSPGVVRVVEDTYHENVLKLDESTPLIRGLQSQISSAGLSADGSGIRVCVCDTGIDMDHLMYADRIDTSASYDFHNNDPNPEDDHGHGAHVAGIAVGGTGLSVDFGCDGSEPFQGVAPGATLIGVKILNANGGGSDSNIIAGIDHCADQSALGGRADVINLSIGTGNFSGTCDSDSWAVAANNAVDAGVVVVAAAGNEGYSNALSTPACGSKVIAVGATYKSDYPNCEDGTSEFDWCLDPFCFFSLCTDSEPWQDQHVCFSNSSSNLDVVAPGAVIWSASTAAGGSSITTMSGTSQASPHVAGLAALILSDDPTLTPAEVRQIIRGGAIDMSPEGFDPSYGYGRIDVIDSLSQISPCATDADCDDGLFCNGVETCSAGDCLSGQEPCPGETCDENANACLPLVCDEDGICEQGEDCNNCPIDCISGGGQGGVCGNGVCEPSIGEDCLSCAADCAGKQVGAAKRQYCCGDGDGTKPVDCADPRCTNEGFECGDAPPPYCCGDEVCDAGEDQCSCSADCGDPPSNETDYCSDDSDNDCDGQIDGDDPDCGGGCLPKRATCTLDNECCSNWCHRGTCK